MKNTNLNLAKKLKNDEFYTLYSEVEKECQYYIEYFKNQWIYLPCDSEESNFWKYFVDNFKEFGLKQLTATHINFDGSSYRLDYDGNEIIKTMLNGNGDFRSEECTTIKNACDIIITNPPFSLFREFVTWLMNKKFIIIGSKNAITYKEIFPLIKDNKLWIGVNNVKDFNKPDGKTQTFGNIGWFTNIEHRKRNTPLVFFKKYNSNEYPKYDNYDAIEVSKVDKIPEDYDGVMGVPITFLDKYCPNQFEIVGIDRYVKDNPKYGQRFTINSKECYARLLIKKKNPS